MQCYYANDHGGKFLSEFTFMVIMSFCVFVFVGLVRGVDVESPQFATCEILIAKFGTEDARA